MTEREPGNQETPFCGRWFGFAALMVVVALFVSMWRWGGPLGVLFGDQEQIRDWLAGFGPLAPLISIALNAAQVLLAPVPGQVIALANGFLFGVFWGTIYSLTGVVLGSAIAMALARALGRPVVERVVHRAHLDRWDRLAARRGPLFFLLVYLLPLLPDDIVSFAVGLSRLSIPYILILAAVGRLPGLVASSWIGANASTISPLGWLILGVTTLALAIAVLGYRDRLEALVLRWTESRSKHHPENRGRGA